VKTVLFSLMAIGLVGGLAGGALFAHFTDTETSQPNRFVAGEWYTNLKCDINGIWYDDDDQQPGGPNLGFPLFGDNVDPDIKPCHGDAESVSIHFDSTNPTEDLYILLTNITEDGGPTFEPEGAGADNGELGKYLHLVFWMDDGNDAIKDAGESDIWDGYLSDLTYDPDMGGWSIPNTPIVGLAPDVIYYVGISWHFDQNEGVNEAMGDNLSFEVVFAVD